MDWDTTIAANQVIQYSTNEYINTYRNQLYQDRQMNGQIERLEIDRYRYRYKTKKHCFSI